MQIDIINGPNLNLIGQREPSVYGNVSFDEILPIWEKELGGTIQFFQSNVEGEIVNALQQSKAEGIILNAGAYTHTSIAIRDCIAAIKIPVVEVHLSNIASRESFRHTSFLTPVCVGCIFGFGMESYAMAINYFQRKKGN